MNRYPHYLHPAAGGLWPSHVLCVDCLSAHDDYESTATRRVESLVTWQTVSLTLVDGTYGVVRHAIGTDVDGFWRLLAELTVAGPSIWILSNDCSRVWSLLEVYRMIENDDLLIAHSDTREILDADAAELAVRQTQTDRLAPVSAGGVSRHLERRGGCLVLEDPPCIMSGRLRDCKAGITWVDLRNYGVHLPDTVSHGRRYLDWLSQWVRDSKVALDKAKLGSLKATSGSQAMHGWRHGHYVGGVDAHCDQRLLTLEQGAYYGGRCEPLWIGTPGCRLWHLDIRSCYGWVMATVHMPVRAIDYHTYGPDDQPWLGDITRGTIAVVNIRTDEPAYPVRVMGDIIYPIGTYWTTLAGPELADALDRKRVLQIRSLATYECEPILASYADTCYQMRCEAEATDNIGISQLAKSLLVSLPGKFGQRSKAWQQCPDAYLVYLYGEWYGSDSRGDTARYRSVGGVVQREVDQGLSADACPAIAAWVCSDARMRLLQMVRCAGWNHVYYMDTDSLMVDEVGLAALQRAMYVQPGVWGYLTLKRVSEKVEIRGVKYYVEDGRITCSGLPKGQCVDAGDGEHYWYHASPSEQVARQTEPVALHTLRHYARSAHYRHGRVTESGRILPIEIGGG